MTLSVLAFSCTLIVLWHILKIYICNPLDCERGEIIKNILLSMLQRIQRSSSVIQNHFKMRFVDTFLDIS